MGKLNSIGLVVMFIILGIFLFDVKEVKAITFEKESEVRLIPTDFDRPEVANQIIVKNGIISDMSYNVQDIGDESPQSLSVGCDLLNYTNIAFVVPHESCYENASLSTATFTDLQLYILHNGEEPIIEINDGSQENPYDFSNVDLSKGNSISPYIYSDEPVFHKVNLQKDKKYYFNGYGVFSNLNVYSPNGEKIFNLNEYDQDDKERFMEIYESGIYIIESSNDFSLLQVQDNEQPLLLSDSFLYESKEKEFAIDTRGQKSLSMSFQPQDYNASKRKFFIKGYEKTDNGDSGYYSEGKYLDEWVLHEINTPLKEEYTIIEDGNSYSYPSNSNVFIVEISSFVPDRPNNYFLSDELEWNSEESKVNFSYKTTPPPPPKVSRESKEEVKELKTEERESSMVADPVDSFRGNFVDNRTLMSYSSSNALNFEIQYDSIANDSKALQGGFTHNFETYLEEIEDSIIVYWTPNMKTIFQKQDDGTYISNSSSHKETVLYKTETGYTAKALKEEFTFDSNGNVLKVYKENGAYTEYYYENEKLEKVKNEKGQTFTFDYNENGLLNSVKDKADRVLLFSYDSQKLVGITLPNESIFTIQYEDTDPSELDDYKVSVLQNDGITLVRNIYNENGAVSNQYDALGNETKFYYDEWSNPNQITTTIIDPDGNPYLKVHNLAGNLIEETDKKMNSRFFEFDEQKNKIKETDFNGNETRYEYNNENHLVKTTYPDGSYQEFSYDEAGNISILRDADGESAFFLYENGNLLESIDKSGLKTIFEYDSYGNVLTTQVGERITSMTYDENGNLIAVINPAEEETKFEYDLLGRVTKTILFDEKYSIQEYDIMGNVVKTINTKGDIKTLEYNNFGNLVREVDENGRITDNSYDLNGNLIEINKGLRGVINTYDTMNRLISKQSKGYVGLVSYTYDENGRLLSTKDENNIQTLFEYDKNGNQISITKGTAIQSLKYDNMDRLISSIDALGNETKYVFELGASQPESINSPSGRITSYVYDKMNRVVLAINPKGDTTEFSYDAYGNKVEEIDDLGNRTVFEYNKSNRLISTTNALGEKTTIVYNNLGQINKNINSLNEITHLFEYNDNGKVEKITDGNGHSNRFIYDATGNLIERYDGKNELVKKLEYNEFNELISEVDALNRKQQQVYNNRGFLIKTISAQNVETKYTYRNNGSLLNSIDAYGTTATNTYNNRGLVTKIQNASNLPLQYQYNLNDRITKEILPTGYALTYSFNNEGEIITRKNARNSSSQYQYDKNSNLVKETTEEGVILSEYDSLNRIVKTTSPSGTIERKYDALGRVTEKIQDGKSIKYEFNKRGHLAKITYPDEKVVSYSYDVMGNMKTVEDWTGKVTSYNYNENNQLAQTTHSNGIIETRTYDVMGQLVELKSAKDDKSITHIKYEYDADGNIVKETDVKTGKDNDYGYDLLGRLKTANQNSYQYTPTGNMSSYTINQNGLISTKKMFYGQDNELTRIGSLYTNNDEDGNLLDYTLNGKTHIATYDSKNQLIQYGYTEYRYDDEGNRIGILENDVSWTTIKDTSFIIDNDSQRYSRMLVETNDEEDIFYVYGQGLISEYRNGQAVTHHYDYRGSTIATTDESGMVIGEASYDEYGVVLNNSLHTRFMYNGQYGVETDVNGLYYMRTRYYNVDLKRFMNRDVVVGNVQESQSLNRYAFVNGNPINFNDPFGMAREIVQNTKAQFDLGAAGHGALDVIGMIPVVGEIADIANAIWYLAEGDYTNAVLSGVGAIPGVGNIASGVKWISKLDNVGRHVGRELNKGWGFFKNKMKDQGGYIQPNSFVPKKKNVDKKSNLLEKYSKMGIPPLKNKELLVGDYKTIKSPPIAEIGDNLTGHHMPSKAHIAQYGIKSDDGIVLNLETTRHIATHTYGRSPNDLKEYMKLSPRDALAWDIKDTRGILMASNFDRKVVNNAMRELVSQSQAKHSAFRK